MRNPFGLSTRRCTKADYRFCYELTKKTLWPFISVYVKPDKKLFDERFNQQYKEVTILMKGERRIGFFMLTKEEHTLTITKLFLSPAYQGKGIGTFLMNYFETLGYHKLYLQVWENNPAVAFYKKAGYAIIAKKQHKYTMEKAI